MKRSFFTVFRDNSLSIVLFGLFFLMLVGMSIAGLREGNGQLASHGEAPIGYIEYISSGGFIEAVFENWESEFLQMGALVILTIFLRQRGSTDSKKLRGKEAEDTSSRYSIIHASTLRRRGRAMREALYANSLSIALFSIFLLSFIIHAVGGVAAFNEEATRHGEAAISTLQYVTTDRFWFESLQNWQSEFLAVGSLLVLSIFLRQRGSPESKPIGEQNARTGSE